MPDDRLPALLEEVRKRDARTWAARGDYGELLAALDAAANDVSALLKALDEVLKLAGEAEPKLWWAGGGPPCGWTLDPEAVREAITRELTGEAGHG